MARSAAPKSGKTTVLKERVEDDKGLIITWDKNWPEAKELDDIVKNGRVDGMKPKEVRDLYPNQFMKFKYHVFASGLYNARKRHNKAVADRKAPPDRELFLPAI
jgi:hypothetical protein